MSITSRADLMILFYFIVNNYFLVYFIFSIKTNNINVSRVFLKRISWVTWLNEQILVQLNIILAGYVNPEVYSCPGHIDYSSRHPMAPHKQTQ